MASPPPAHEQPDKKGLPKFGSVLYQAAIEFPKNAYSIQRVPDQHASNLAATAAAADNSRPVTTTSTTTKTTTTTTTQTDGSDAAMPHRRKDSGFVGDEHRLKDRPTVSPALVELCQSNVSVSGLMAEDPSLTPGQAWKKLLEHSKIEQHSIKHRHHHKDSEIDSTEADELEVAYRCGRWGETRPSDLFLRVSLRL